MGRLQEKVAIVTGAASGIGLATAKLMASHGAKVVAADINFDGVKKVVEEIRQAGGDAISVSVNALEEESIQEMITIAKVTYRKVDILFNNVGGTKADKDHAIVDLDKETWDFAFRLNLRSIGYGCKHVIPHLIENSGGSIINTASMAGILGDLDSSAYGSVKAGVISLTRYVATQHGKQGIRCNAVAPGLILTPATEAYFTEEVKQRFVRHNVLNRLGKPEDIAQTVLFLASDASSFITGQTIQVDGGSGIHAGTFAEFMEMRDQH
ncbi:NAD(P)-dependent dehydrogenase, short-chain alcohol dehydrogenase family [Seinonella peptonophila]|uniref:NAD(P)-dependent dehydrogenase, short-chain alcohol dehydrogenase family n=1 Tax=Seinonella peptonophila TaxID=112248 RepID=A0A1M4YE07_9BACL|nr:SDR family NAD(P)-dependent oxidoreductase [Seinonella peptonophila]SHF03990.1 NAD(P)-dependent dehydrogenase, short-chain alcohol dehydrogenase family [Seinonella peptonophila]